MAPISTVVTGLLRQAVHYHLDNSAWSNALFFAERLSAHDARGNESAYLLALCHLRLADYRSAYEVSKPLGYRGLHLGCAFVFAQSCLALERFRDGALALEKSKNLWLHKSHFGKHTATTRGSGPDAAVINCLLGKLYRGMDDRKKAAAYFEDALRLNPLMWDAFTALCDTGLNVRVFNTFRVSEAFLHCFEPAHNDSKNVNSSGHQQATPSYLTEQVPQLPSKQAGGLSSRQPAAHEMSDPFDHLQASSHQSLHSKQRQAASRQQRTGSTETEENDFMAKIFAARSPTAASGNGNGGQSSLDALTTPSGMQQEPPHVPSRRRGAAASTAMSTDTSLSDGRLSQQQQHQHLPAPSASSRTSHRSEAATRRGRTVESNTSGDQSAGDHASTLLRPTANGSKASTSAASSGAPSSAITAERKRTASGHPVAPRQATAQPDEAGVPQRRSARLNMFSKTSAGRTNAGAAGAGATATRELKKARPPISRIIRPGSSISTVGRVVSGNRKPVDDGNMDVDQMEAPRIRDPVIATPPVPPTLPQQQQQQQQRQQQHNVPQHPAAQRAANDMELLKIEEALRWILDLLRKLGGGYLALSQFQCTEVTQIYKTLPRTHLDTPWVQALLGRAHYELAAYPEAEVCFRRVRVLAPTRLEDMEVYSTILWFLKRETDLSFLAHELVDAAWQSPQAWCALGNAWSLAQDHEQALRCFRRATQLDPNFAYAYTLQGHEHVLNEECDKALTAYRHAVAADRRHYNAYYGIGRVYEKLGNFDKAYAHYQAAAVIHPNHAVLICCIGKVLERQKQILPALQYFSKATDLAPRAAQTRFRKARALLAIGQLQAAQQELMILKDLAPDEAAVHFLLGRLYKTLNDKSAAVRHFTIALSLDPKACQKIKQAIGSLEDDDDGFGDNMVA
ncbi:anaphase-promoting complex subunit cdc27 [Sporothrix epigloea]|uniref:Anaphase-promoting complex subunit cdc27 n=1 Tax=Sporothrix epigloea TaxID=1892477 RepID=A0ABP0DL22_9PEZI